MSHSKTLDNQSEVYKYLTNKYIELGLLDSFGNRIESKSGFDFTIYPDSGYIPPCSICKSMVVTLGTVEAKHMSCGCLWFDYYKTKILKSNPSISFVNNKTF